MESTLLEQILSELLEIFPNYNLYLKKLMCASHGDLNKLQLVMLLSLYHHHSLTMGELTEHAHTTPEQSSRAILPLEEQGYLTRTIHPENRRKVLVTITPEGETYFQALRTEFQQTLLSSFQILSQSEQEEFLTSLHTVSRLLGKMIQPEPETVH